MYTFDPSYHGTCNIRELLTVNGKEEESTKGNRKEVQYFNPGRKLEVGGSKQKGCITRSTHQQFAIDP